MAKHIIVENEPVRLDADTEKVTFTSLPGERGAYHVTFNGAPYLMLVMGASYGTALSKLEHPRLLARVCRVHEYKHYRQNGSKFWTAKPGIDLYCIVRKEDVTVVPEWGASYPKVMVNGVTLQLNVSGGTFPAGEWTDSVGAAPHTSVGYPVKTVKAVLDVALTPNEALALGLATDLVALDPDGEREFLGMAAALVMRPKLGEGAQVVIGHGYSYNVGTGPFPVEGKFKRTWYARAGFGRLKVPDKVIDWLRTARLNDVPVPAVSDLQFSRLGGLIERRKMGAIVRT